MDDFKLPRIFDADSDLNQRWFVYYYYKNPDTGKFQRFRVFISSKYQTKTARYTHANEIKAEIKRKLLSGFNPFSSRTLGVSLQKALDFAVDYKLSVTGKRTAFTYRSVAKLFLEWAETKEINDKPVKDCSRKHIQKYLDDCLIVEKVSNRTHNNRLRSLKTLFNVLLEREYVDFNPILGIKLIKVNEPGITAYTPEELATITGILPAYNYQLYVISQLIFYCFLRPAELVRLQFKDVMWDNQMILVPGNKSKNGKTETIVIPDQLFENLKDWNRDYPSDWYLFGKMLNPGPEKISPNRISDWWRLFKKKYNFTKNIYDMKHTGNGMAFDQDLNARDIQLQNRHYSLDQTQQYLNKFRRKASDKFVKTFKGY